jgi:Tfp pilus assembly PilM family ATPase
LRFKAREGKEVERIILAGGGAKLPGLLQYFQNYFKKEVEIANPFKKIYFPPILEETLNEIGPSFSIAVGLALRAFE